ncbi:MAG TPA: purine-nucleoside phosphorylase [Vicinamibacteria bacterium]|nr:purine-nucleoside phosphorylase [Vicinamibacteria bacterium]
MSLQGELNAAAAFVRSRSDLAPAIGLVLGSGLGAFAKSLDGATAIPFGDIPHFPTSTAIGHKGELALGRSHGVPLAVMAGRVHLYEGYSAAQVAFPVRVLARLGVKTLILTNAAGGVNVNYKPGELVVLEDHINLTGHNPLVGPNPDELGPRFPDMTDVYDQGLREIAEQACWKAGVPVRKGVYLGLTGPSYETPAEVRMARTLGADVVGMSTVLEAIAARHMGLRCLGISCVTNLAAGVLKKKIHHQEVLDVGERVKQGLLEVLGQIVQAAAKLP